MLENKNKNLTKLEDFGEFNLIDLLTKDLKIRHKSTIKSTSYFSQARVIPAYNSSMASCVNLLEMAMETVMCFAIPFIAYISDRFTITAL